MTKNIIVGATGYIGAKLAEKSKAYCKTVGTSSRGQMDFLKLDLANPKEFDFSIVEEGTTIMLAAAVSSPDVCANSYDTAYALNVTGSKALIDRVIDRGGRLIFFASDTIYGETEKSVDEQSPLNPLGEYAEMKAEIEEAFKDELSFKSIRLSYVFSAQDKFTRYLQGCCQKSETAEIFDPFYRPVVHRDDVVEGVLALAQKWDEIENRVINFGGPDLLSRVDFTDTLKNVVFHDLKVKVAEPEPAFFEKRPRIINMKSSVFETILGRAARPIREAAQIEFN